MCFAHFVGRPVRHCVAGINKCIILLLLCWCHVCCSVCAGAAVNMMRLCQMVAFITICTQTPFNHFWGIFGHFYPISLDKLVIVQIFPILNFWDTKGHDQLGKKLQKIMSKVRY